MCSTSNKKLKTDADVDQLIDIFNSLFAQSEKTVLVRGQEEPVYIPADEHCDYHQIVFAHGFFASALHEIAHWCIAGNQRRLLLDYGYWYAPDGRTKKQQAEFESVEVKPQALEWMLSKSCNKPFRVSIDNLSGEECDTGPFKKAVLLQVHRYCLEGGIPSRAKFLMDNLKSFYGSVHDFDSSDFDIAELN
jgi:elongation factor P hydroxylase